MPYDNFFVFDDKGNEITNKGNCATIVTSSSSDFYYNCDFVSLKRIPKYLTVVPYRIYHNKAESNRILKDIDGTYPMELLQGKLGKIIINKITTESDKTIVNYSVKGFVPNFQSEDIYLMDDKNEIIGSTEASKQKENSSNEYTMEFEALDKNRKYKIGTSDFSDIEIRNDLKFKINLK